MQQTEPAIPKIIHYVWLGNGRKSQVMLDCIRSWQKYCPDYEIKEWNEATIKNLDNIFLKEALSSKRWAFASDYLRLYALYTQGGFYFDTDLEITAPIDQFLNHRFVCAFEKKNLPSTAFIGAVPGDQLIKEILSYYDNRHFIVRGKPDLTVNPVIFRSRIQHAFPQIKRVKASDTLLDLGDRRVIYPDAYFVRKTGGEPNFAIHHFEASWKAPKDATVFETCFKLGPLEIFKSKSRAQAVFPPKIDPALSVLSAFTYRRRRRIYVALRRPQINT